MPDELTTEEREAMEAAVNTDSRWLDPDGWFEAGWIAARDYYRAEAEQLREALGKIKDRLPDVDWCSEEDCPVCDCLDIAGTALTLPAHCEPAA